MRIRAERTTSVSGWNDNDESGTEVWTAAEQRTKRIAHGLEETAEKPAREADQLANKTARERAGQLQRDH